MPVVTDGYDASDGSGLRDDVEEHGHDVRAAGAGAGAVEVVGAETRAQSCSLVMPSVGATGMSCRARRPKARAEAW